MRKKCTGAIIVSVIELVAVLGVYIGLGATLGVNVAKAKGWIEGNADRIEDSVEWSDEELNDWIENNDEVYAYDYPAEPEATPVPYEPVYCPHCGWELEDEYSTYCYGCGLDPNAPAPTPTPMPELVVAQGDATAFQFEVVGSGYGKLYVDSTWESSIVDQKGTHNNSASALVDNNLETSWQEGVSGDGLGESVMLDFGHDVEVAGLELYLGNHRTDEWFYKNNVPQQVTVMCYGAADGEVAEFKVEKESHQRGATYVILNRPVQARYVEIFIDSVYKGSKYDDTCIAEVYVYGND